MQRIQRPSTRRNYLPFIACGCIGIVGGAMLVAGIVLLLLIPAMPGLALQFSGFQSKGSTNTVFQNVPPAPTVAVQNAAQPQQATINLGSYGSQPIAIEPNQTQYQVVVGTGNTGAPLATVSFTESGLMDMCYQRADLCGNSNAQYRNPRLDLRPGGAIIYADVYIPNFGIWQPIGVVLRLDNSQRQFQVAGVDVNGTLYDLPSSGLGDQVADVARVGNDMLNQLSLEASGGRYALSQVIIDDTTLTLVMH
jgi:hypothetical protein